MSISQKDNKEIVLENHLSTEQKWLLEITSTHFGINQRIKNLLIKIHDTPRKPKLIHDGLREISLSDMWFYKAHQESEKAFQTILTLFNKLLNIEGLDKQDKWLFLNTLIEFILEIIQNDGIGIDTLVAEILTILENSLLDDPEIRIYASSLSKRPPAQFAKGSDYLQRR